MSGPIEEKAVRIPLEEGLAVSAVMAIPANFRSGRTRCLILAHGAGTDMHHPLLSFFHRGLAHKGWLSVKFNFPYKEKGRKAPDRPEKLEGTYRQVIRFCVQHPLRPGAVFAGGKSMGGRIASHMADQGEDLAGLFFLGYPLHPPHRPANLRSAHLLRISTPMLFVQGSKDPFCRLDLLRDVLRHTKAPSRVHVIEGGNHDFRVPKRSGRSAEEIHAEIVEAIADWLATVSPLGP